MVILSAASMITLAMLAAVPVTLEVTGTPRALIAS